MNGFAQNFFLGVHRTEGLLNDCFLCRKSKPPLKGDLPKPFFRNFYLHSFFTLSCASDQYDLPFNIIEEIKAHNNDPQLFCLGRTISIKKWGVAFLKISEKLSIKNKSPNVSPSEGWIHNFCTKMTEKQSFQEIIVTTFEMF